MMTEPMLDANLKSNVLFGYADIVAAGCRTLLGLQMGHHYSTLPVRELSLHTSVKCQRATTPLPQERYFEPFQILNCKFEQYSLVIVNSEINAEKCHYVIDKLMTLCRLNKVQKIIALTCLRTVLTPEFDKNTYFENIFYLKDKLTYYPELPLDTVIRDPLLLTLLQMNKVEQLPLSLISAVGHKADFGLSHDCEFAQQVIKTFQEKLNELTGLEFSYDFSLSLVFEEYHRCYTVMGLYS